MENWYRFKERCRWLNVLHVAQIPPKIYVKIELLGHVLSWWEPSWGMFATLIDRLDSQLVSTLCEGSFCKQQPRKVLHFLLVSSAYLLNHGLDYTVICICAFPFPGEERCSPTS